MEFWMKVRIFNRILFVFLLFTSINLYSKEVELNLIFTSDEHGWMLNEGKNGGAAEMYNQWLTMDSIKSKNTLIVSGGDNYTGTAISTFTKGKSMQEVMNAMGYNVSAIGNHEFDYGLTELNKLISEADYNYVAANVKFKHPIDTNKNLSPYVIKEIGGIRVAFLGLSNTLTPALSSPKNVKDVQFIDYEHVLNQMAKKVSNCEIKVLLTHICSDELKKLIPIAKKNGFSVILGGHCHTKFAELIDSVAVVEGNPYMRGYAKINMRYDEISRKVIFLNAEQIPLTSKIKAPEIESVITKWKDSTDKVLKQPLGYSDSEFETNSPALINLILNSWLRNNPDAKVAMANRGGIRQPLPKGEITLANIMGILPFDNELYVVEMTGKAIKEIYEKRKPFISGVNQLENYKFEDGTYMLDDAKYFVVIPDFIYNNGDNYSIKDCSKYIRNTGENPRDPLVKYLRKLNTSWNNSLTKYLDYTPKCDMGTAR